MIKNSGPKVILLSLVASLVLGQGPRSASADIELPIGSLAGCPFIHEDAYDLAPLLATLQAQLETSLKGKNECLQSMQSIYSSLNSMQDFYKSIDPTIKQKIAQGVYANAQKALAEKKLLLELHGESGSAEYSSIVSQIEILNSESMANGIDLRAESSIGDKNAEAYYRTQLLSYTSSLINAYTSTLRTNPKCIDTVGGWNQALSALFGGFSIATGMGLNPASQIIGASASVASQLVSLLKDSKVRSAYNDLIRLKNYKTLACTYFAVQKAACEYEEAYEVGQDSGKLREFVRNRFKPGAKGDYDRYFVNRGRIAQMGKIFAVIAQMGSPLTLDQSILSSYLNAKSVDFDRLGTPPPPSASDDTIKSWLIRARAYGVVYSEFNYNTQQSVPLRDQLQAAMNDIELKKSTIAAAEKVILENLSFLDLRRRLSSDFPIAKQDVTEMMNYLTRLKSDPIILDSDKGTIDAALVMLTKLKAFLDVTIVREGVPVPNYEEQVVATGGAVFEEIAHGSVAQLTKQSVVGLAGKATDRLGWAFGVIRNAYLNRDQIENLPADSRFGEYMIQYEALADVIANYNNFSGAGVTFRNEDIATATRSFRESFKNELLGSLQSAITNHEGIPELRGATAAHLCALYAPSLEKMSRDGLFGKNKASKLLQYCRANYKTLQSNRLVATKDFAINYDDDCTYVTYSREREIQNLLAQLIK